MRKLNLFLWFMFFSILYYHLIWCSSTIIVEPCKITVWRLQSAKVPNYACPVVCLYRCCNEIENLYTDFESCISVIADSRNYDYEINGYIWIVTLLLWVFFVMIFNLRYCWRRAIYVWALVSVIESYRWSFTIPNLCCLSGSMIALVQPSGWELAELGDFAEFQDTKIKQKNVYYTLSKNT